jgi:hypothetical protein
MSDQPGFGVDDLDRLAQRAVDAVLRLVRRGIALAGGVLIIAAFCCIVGFLLGLAALSGGIRSVWVVLGGFFLVVGVGSVIVAIWRLRSVRKGAHALVGEVRTLIAGDRQTERVVIETIESSEESKDDGVVVLSRQFFDMQNSIGDRQDQFKEISSALRAITTFPALIALTTVVSFVFAGLGLLFLIALAL